MNSLTNIKNRNTQIIITLCAAILLLFILAIYTGSVSIDFRSVYNALFNPDSDHIIREIVLNFRLPRAITALICGVALSVCGLQMQTMLRNPLADPYILGISSGAGLGVALFIMGLSIPALSGASNLLSSLGMVTSAWIGSLLVTLLILSVSNKLKDTLSLLIFGVMLGSVGSAIIGLLQYLSSAPALKSYVLWSMGSFSGLTYTQIIIMAILATIGVIMAIYNIKDLNILLLGDTYVSAMGINIKRVRLRILISATLLAGSVTAFCGPIGFVGIAAPHIARMIFKNANHRLLLPAAAICGALMMQTADIISQLPGTSTVIPINTISALLGIPVILFIILKKRS